MGSPGSLASLCAPLAPPLALLCSPGPFWAPLDSHGFFPGLFLMILASRALLLQLPATEAEEDGLSRATHAWASLCKALMGILHYLHRDAN